MRIIKPLLALCLLLFGSANVLAQDVCKRNLEPQGGFSLCVPDGWTAEQAEGEKYKEFFAPAVKGYRTNINMNDASSTVPLDEFATATVDYVVTNKEKLGFTEIKLLTRGAFTAESGLVGIKLTFHIEHQGLLIRTIQYVFDGHPGQKLALTCTTMEADEVMFGPVCDHAAKSLKLEDQASPAKPE